MVSRSTASRTGSARSAPRPGDVTRGSASDSIEQNGVLSRTLSRTCPGLSPKRVPDKSRKLSRLDQIRSDQIKPHPPRFARGTLPKVSRTRTPRPPPRSRRPPSRAEPSPERNPAGDCPVTSRRVPSTECRPRNSASTSIPSFANFGTTPRRTGEWRRAGPQRSGFGSPRPPSSELEPVAAEAPVEVPRSRTRDLTFPSSRRSPRSGPPVQIATRNAPSRRMGRPPTPDLKTRHAPTSREQSAIRRPTAPSGLEPKGGWSNDERTRGYQ